MALESYQWFVALIEEGTFTQTAERLQMSQQTLSSRLASLERDLGAKLVLRSTPLRLTRAGEAFLRYAKDHLEARTEMLRRVSEVTVGGSGQIKVGISNIRSMILMPKILREFQRSLPGVTVKFIEGTNDELLSLAQKAEADIVIAHFDSVHPGVDVQPLYHEEVELVIADELLERYVGVPAEEAVALVEEKGLILLNDCPFLLETNEDLIGYLARNELQRVGIRPKTAAESESILVLLALASEGLGAVFCSTLITDYARAQHSSLMRIRLKNCPPFDISIGMPRIAKPWLPAQTFEDIAGALYSEKNDTQRD